jgi:hypothetical protein
VSYDLRGLDVTVVLTSCGRLNELAQTLAGFHQHFIPEHFIVIDDKADSAIATMLARDYPHIEIVLNSPQLGQFKSIDKAYGLVKTKYIFHMEDDWSISAANNIQSALYLLEKTSDLSCICLRSLDDLKAKLKKRVENITFENEEFVKMAHGAHPEYFGITFNPMLIKRETWENVKPLAQFKTEEAISLHFKKQRKTIAYFKNGQITHIGINKHVEDPTQPKRARGFLARLKRSIEKRINRIKRKFQP